MMYDYMTPGVVNEIKNLPVPELQSAIVDMYHNQRQEQYDLLNNSGRTELTDNSLLKMNFILTTIIGTMDGTFNPESDDAEEYYNSMLMKNETILEIMGDERTNILHQTLLDVLCETEDLQECVDISTNFMLHSTCSFINRFVEESNG